jgi:undecaprenyl-diphosphatase
MNAFDERTIEFLNRLSQHAHAIDESVALLDSDLFKGGAVIAMVWWAWFSDEAPDAARRRSTLISALVACIGAVFFARGLAHVLPFRARPLYTPGLDFVPPFGTESLDLEHWSSFPSDHAVVFFTLATGLWYARRSLGMLAYAYTAVFICLPRLYLGIHWPTDILAGAAIGVAIGWAGTRDVVRRNIGDPLLAWKDRAPGPFYAVLFLVTFEVAVLGADARNLASHVHAIF